jgi:glutamate transport system substrate-binding protein
MRTTRPTLRRSGALAATALSAMLVLTACGDDDGDGGGGDSTDGGGDTITIGIKFDQPGLGLRDGDTYSGFDVDVATYVAGELGYSEDQIEWHEAPSPERENLLENGTVDMVFATYSITDERKERIDFAGPYFVAGQSLLVAADDTEITGPDTMDGKLLCSVTGSTSAQRIQDEYSAGVQLQESDTYSNCVELLTGGQIDAVTTDDIILAGFAAQSGGALKVVGDAFSEENYGVGLPEDTDLCEDVNTAIEQMIEDGSWQEALDANVGETDFEPNTDLNPPTPEACEE